MAYNLFWKVLCPVLSNLTSPVWYEIKRLIKASCSVKGQLYLKLNQQNAFLQSTQKKVAAKMMQGFYICGLMWECWEDYLITFLKDDIQGWLSVRH